MRRASILLIALAMLLLSAAAALANNTWNGYHWPDGADRAVCSCGWISAAIQRDKPALIALWEVHAKRADASSGGVAE